MPYLQNFIIHAVSTSLPEFKELQGWACVAMRAACAMWGSQIEPHTPCLCLKSLTAWNTWTLHYSRRKTPQSTFPSFASMSLLQFFPSLDHPNHTRSWKLLFCCLWKVIQFWFSGMRRPWWIFTAPALEKIKLLAIHIKILVCSGSTRILEVSESLRNCSGAEAHPWRNPIFS